MIPCKSRKRFKYGYVKRLAVILDRNNIEDLLKLLGDRLDGTSRSKLRYKAAQCVKHNKSLVLSGLTKNRIKEGDYVMYGTGGKHLISYDPEQFNSYFDII